MSTTTSYRLSGMALIIGSVLSIIYYVSEVFINGPFPEALAGPVAVIGSLIGFIGSALVLLGLPGVYTRQMKLAGILGLLGFLFVWYVILFQGVLIPFTSVTVVPVIVTDAASRHLLATGPLASFDPFDYVSMVGATLGILLLAIATLRARVFPRWIVWLLIATVVLNAVSFVPFSPNAVSSIASQVGYLPLIGFGYSLLSLRRRDSVQATPASAKVEARAVNRLLYGQRDEPYAVISHLGQRLEATIAPDTVLSIIVETVAQVLKLPYTAIALKQGEQFAIAASYMAKMGEPPASNALLYPPLLYQSERVGELLLAPRARGESFTPADRRLLDDLARQIGVAVHAVRLTADLQRSRERLVTAREEERRRLRRDLHDGLGPALASITLKLDAARNLLTRDPSAADALLVDLKKQTQTAVSDIRRLVYELRPPSLDELGLMQALREQAEQYLHDGLRITIDAPEPLPPLPAAVEVATYRIVQEAMTNVVRHAQARTCVIRFALDNGLDIEICDDGRGIPAGQHAGVGLTSMRERAAELGGIGEIESVRAGGTRLHIHLPLSRATEEEE